MELKTAKSVELGQCNSPTYKSDYETNLDLFYKRAKNNLSLTIKIP